MEAPKIISVDGINDKFFDRVQSEQEVNWNVVKIIVDKYTDRHLEEVLGCEEVVKTKRKNLNNKFAETSADTEMRHMYELPPSLHFALTMKYPLIFKSQKTLYHFLRMFPSFCIPEKL